MTEQQTRHLDADARRQVLDAAGSFIVQAPAGAGKTELLIQRYLALLATVDSPEEIVAITFTRKAAAEMRARVLSALAFVHDGDETLKDHQKLTRDLALTALNRDARLGWNLEKHPARMRIMTIDALNGWLARQLPWQSGIGGQIAVSDEADELHLEAARATLQGKGASRRLLEQIERLLVHLDNRYDLIEERIASLLAVREQWLRLLGDGNHPAREVLEGALSTVVTTHLDDLAHGAPAWVSGDLPDLAAHAVAQLMAAGSLDDKHAFAPLHGMSGLPGAGTADLPGWQAIASLLLTADNSVRKPKGVNKNQGFPSGDGRKAEFQNLLVKLTEEHAFVDMLGAVRSLPSATYDDQQWEMLGAIVDILQAGVENLHDLFVARGVVDHTEVATAALGALGEDLAPTDLAMILEHRIQHLLVDEFQDTSIGQFALIERLTAAWTEGDGHTLFLVGDPMQSIYRFREAEVGLFLRAWTEQRIGSVPLKPLRLSLNFRSVPRIVDWINETFAKLLPAVDDLTTGAVSYAPCLAAQLSDEGPEAESGSAVTLRVHFSDSVKDEANYIAEQVRACLDNPAGKKSKDPAVAILVRARTHLAPIATALRESGMRFRSLDIEPLAQTPVVRDLLALTLALVHPGDSLSGFTVLRAPWCGLTLKSLSAIAGHAEGGAVLEAAGGCVEKDRIESEDRVRLLRCLDTLHAAREQRGTKSLRRLVEGCWLRLGGPLCTDEAGTAAAATFFDVLDGCDDGGDITDLREINRRIEALFVPPDPLGDADLQLMTMHKAKGLQFDTVILPRLEATGRHQPDALFLWHFRPRRGGTDFLLAPVAGRGSDVEAIYAWIKRSLQEKDSNERIRLLYVGATRARRRLILTGNLKTTEKDGVNVLVQPRSGSFLNILWPLLESDVHMQYSECMARLAGAMDVADSPMSQPGGQQLSRLPKDWAPPVWKSDVCGDPVRPDLQGADDELRRSPFRAGEHTRVTGIVVHRLLAMLAAEGWDWWNEQSESWGRACVMSVLRQTSAIADSETIVATALEAVRRTLADERGRWILTSRPDSAQEWKLSGLRDGHTLNIIIDRTFVDEYGTRWIIDYKTTEHEGAGTEEFLRQQVDVYTPQLLRYGSIAGAFDGRPVRLGLYFPMMREWREIGRGE